MVSSHHLNYYNLVGGSSHILPKQGGKNEMGYADYWGQEMDPPLDLGQISRGS